MQPRLVRSSHSLTPGHFFVVVILGAASNEILNANSDLVVEEVKPVLESSLADLFTDVANKVTRSFTYKELFPEE